MICASQVAIRSSARRNVALIYDVELNSLERIIPIEEDAGVMMDEIKAFSISPDGKTLGVACSYLYHPTVFLFDLNDGAKPRTLQGWNESDGMNNSIGFSSDGKLVAADSILRRKGSESQPVIKIWDVQSGVLKTTVHVSAYTTQKVRFSPQSNDIAADDGKSIKIWNAGKSDLKKTLSGHKQLITDWNYCNDAKMIVSTDGVEIKVWDVATGKAVATKEVATLANNDATTVDFVYGEQQNSIAVGFKNGELAVLRLKP